jgi:hypothetical protein
LMPTAASATSATAAITIHICDFICVPPWTGWAEGVRCSGPPQAS